MVILGFLAAAIWIDAHWSPEDRALTLRLRASSEIVDTVRARSLALGQRVVAEARDRLAPVGAGPSERVQSSKGDSEPLERITREDRERLDRLIAEKARAR